MIANKLDDIQEVLEDEQNEEPEEEEEETEEVPEEDKTTETPTVPETPSTPVTPSEPTVPETPVTPVEPVVPETPVTPSEPTVPETPVTPSEPTVPETPVTPVEPEKPVTPDTPSEGDVLNGTPFTLNEGEVAYNSETGVDVTYTGEAHVDNGDGTSTELEDRDLEENKDGSVTVTEQDLAATGVKEEEPEVPTTGDEITYDEAVSEESPLTEGEQQNLESAIDDFDWTSYFNENSPTLTP